MTTEHADVVVVGGGIVGLCAAHSLRSLGADVIVVERGQLHDPGASHGNAGMIVPSHVVPLAAPGVIAQGLRWLFRADSPFYIKPRASRALWSWLWKFRAACTEEHVRASAPVLRDLCLESVEHFRELTAAGLDFGLRNDGLLLVHATERGRAADCHKADIAAEVGLRVEVLGSDELHRLEPRLRGEALGGVYFPQDCHLVPETLVAALADRLTAAGVRLRENTRATDLEASPGGARVLTDRGSLAGDHVVVAAGAWTARLCRGLGLRLPLEAAKGYSVTLPATAPAPRIPTIFSESKVTLTPMGSCLRFAGTLALTGLDATVDRRRAASILEVAADYTSSSGDRGPIWSGFRPCTPDGLPAIGPIPGAPGVIVATGHGMLGVTLGPVTGRIVGDLVDGHGSSRELRALLPTRFD